MDGAADSANSGDAFRSAAIEPPHPLSESQQRWNVYVFAACTGLQYLAAPVLYVGLTQGSLLNRLGATRTIANLPETAFFIATVTPVLLASLLPGVVYLKRTLVACYLMAAASQALVALALVSPIETNLQISAVIVQGAVSGAAMPTAIALLWEAIGRGVAPSRRGVALGLAFGAGPLLAVAGSFGSQLLLTGKVGSRALFSVAFPWNFAIVFAAGVPVMLLAAVTARGLTVVADGDESAPTALLAGIYRFLSNRLLLAATIVTILLYVGNTITANMNLYTQHVLDADPADYAGYQNMLRFAFKMAAGIVLGWLLTRSTPRTGILVTGLLFLAAQVWALFATGYWYLLAFGIYGAGELVGVYAPNYLLSASAPRDLRRNMAYVTMMMAPAAPAGTLFGALADYGGRAYGAAIGFRLSFALCATILLAGLVLAVTLLPPQPEPQE
jgi:MFS family permease